MIKSVILWMRVTIILLMAAIFYPVIYIFGFLMSVPCGNNPHKSALNCIDNFNEVFE